MITDDGYLSRGVAEESTGPRFILKAIPKEDGDVGGRSKGEITY